MHINYNITTATLGDVDGIFTLESECFSTPWSKESIRNTILNKNNLVLLANLPNNAIIGYMSMECVIDEGYIGNVATAPKYRQCGVARSLIDSNINFAVEKNMSFVTLEVRESNLPAINLYKSMGFLEVGKRNNFYSNPRETALLLTKYLK